MAYTRHTLAAAFRHFPRRLHPSLPHVLSRDDAIETPSASPSPYRSISQFYTSPSPSPGRGVYLPLGLHMSSLRFYSSAPADKSNQDEYIKDIANVFTDASTEATASAAPAAVPASFPGEVAAAAADCSFPVAAFQHLIDQVHTITGLNWWAAIALTAILVKIPLQMILRMGTIKMRKKLGAELQKLKQETRNSMDPQIKQEYQKNVKALLNKHGITLLAPLKVLFIHFSIFMSFYFAISNMVKNVPSLKVGGILWFTDLTTPDPMYIFPVLNYLTVLAAIELGNPMTKGLKNFFRIFALLMIPITAFSPKAFFCWWISTNLFSVVYNTVLKQPAVRKILGIP